MARVVDINADSTSIYIAGNTMSFGNGDFDVVLLRYNQSGNLTLSKTWGGALLDQSHGMAVNDPFIYIAGETKSYGAGNEEAFLFKVDIEGGNVIPEFGPLTLPVFFLGTAVAACTAYLVLHKSFRQDSRLEQKKLTPKN